MRKLYDNQIIDYNEGQTEFVEEFNQQIETYGAIVYNHEYNSYQYITKFEQIDFKNEILPDYFKASTSKLPNGIDILMHYEFRPEEEDDEEVLSVWEELSQMELPTYAYDDDGEVYANGYIKMNTKASQHTIWILNKEGQEYLYQQDMLLVQPIIKYMSIVQEVLRKHTIKPFEEETTLH